jgi:hypothetical protein
VRHSEFWALVEEEFGSGHGRALVQDHVLRSLGYRTAQEALAAHEAPRTVWMAMCDELDIPPERRWGKDPVRRGPSRTGRRR